jgi:hypothetical protein
MIRCRLPPIRVLSRLQPRPGILGARALPWLPVAGVALGQPFLVPGISLADLCLALFAALAVGRLLRSTTMPAFPPWAPWLAAFVLWALVAGAVLAVREPGFSAVEFGKSALKLAFYSAAAVLLALVARREPEEGLQRAVLWSFGLSALLAVALYAAMVAGIPLARDLACGEDVEPCNAAYYYERRWFGDSSPRGLREGVFVRAVGVASEPSRLGLLMSLALGYLLLGTRAPWRSPWPLATIAAAAVLAFSLSGYALLIPVAAMALLRLIRGERRARRVAALAVLAVVVVVAAVPPVRATLEGPISRRARHFFAAGGDESARLRLRGSWDMALLLVERHPVGGVGLGHFDRRVPEIRGRLPLGHALDDTVQGWNALAYVLATTGAVGLLLFVLTCYRALRPAPALGLVFLLAMFADGTVLGPAFWVFFALYADAGARSAAAADPTAAPPG